MSAPEILYEDKYLLAINKPAGLLCQRDKSGDLCALDVMAQHIKKRDRKEGNVFLGLPHRLDRPTSGALLLAKRSKTLSRLSEMIRQREISKTYLALLTAPLEGEEGILTDFLKKNERMKKSFAVSPGEPGAQKAQLEYRFIMSSEGLYLYAITLLTGRFHQIRSQCSLRGAPLLGDFKYGARSASSKQDLGLHAFRLAFKHPMTGDSIQVRAGLPPRSFWDPFQEKTDIL